MSIKKDISYSIGILVYGIMRFNMLIAISILSTK